MMVLRMEGHDRLKTSMALGSVLSIISQGQSVMSMVPSMTLTLVPETGPQRRGSEKPGEGHPT